jgi:hypothetical protein
MVGLASALLLTAVMVWLAGEGLIVWERSFVARGVTGGCLAWRRWGLRVVVIAYRPGRVYARVMAGGRA